MKRIFSVVFILLVLGLTVYGAIYLNQRAIDTAYNNAISLIQSGFYRRALDQLEIANPNTLDTDDFKDDLKYGKLAKVYKNTVPLCAYALAQIEYNEENKNMYRVNDYLNIIPKDYSGELSNEIATFKGNFKPQYDEFLEEQKRRDEELKRELAEIRRKRYEELKTKIPYEGMDESDIDKTIMGKRHKIDVTSKYGYTKYYWYTNSGDIMLIVTCKGGKVTSVSRYGWYDFWTEDMKPIWNGKNSYKKSSSSKKKSDPYNVYDYSDPEDFYYDNYDDFWEYEEAEDYFNEHHG